MRPPLARFDPGRDRRAGDAEVAAPVRDVLLGPQLADEPDELLRPSVAVGLVALGVAVGAEVVQARDDVDPDAAAGEMSGSNVVVRAARTDATVKVSPTPSRSCCSAHSLATRSRTGSTPPTPG
jgi:hypothetical protein